MPECVGPPPRDSASAHLRNALQIVDGLRLLYGDADTRLVRALRRLRWRVWLALVQIERERRAGR